MSSLFLESVAPVNPFEPPSTVNVFVSVWLVRKFDQKKWWPAKGRTIKNLPLTGLDLLVASELNLKNRFVSTHTETQSPRSWPINHEIGGRPNCKRANRHSSRINRRRISRFYSPVVTIQSKNCQ